jgi:hypothetical protein
MGPATIASQFLPRNVPTAWLLAGACIEVVINAWALGFVLRMRACDQGQVRLRAFLFGLQVGVLALLAAFVWAILTDRPRAASWIAAVFFFSGLMTASTMRAWIHRIPLAALAVGKRCGGVTPAEFVAMDAVNWVAIVGVVIKVVGMFVSLWLAVRPET